MRFVFTCGGTAGHINPAVAVAGRLKALMPDCEILFIGAKDKMEMELVPREGYEIKPVEVTNLSRGHSPRDILHNVETLKNVIASEHEARHIIKEFEPDAVIGTGGYVCYPVLQAAAKLGIPTAVHESNAVPGLTTKLLANSVDRVMVGLEESRDKYPDPEKVTVTGTPVRGGFGRYTKNSAKAELGLPAEVPLVVSVWGSLGAGHMNDIVCGMLPLMKGQKRFRLIHSVGSRYYPEFMQRLKSEGIDPALCGAQTLEYIYDMPRVMAAADMIMCRAGASTLAELAYMGKPAILVPSPNVTNNHQEKNARVIEKAGGAKVLLEGEFDPESLLGLVDGLVHDREELDRMSAAMAALAVNDAVERICGIILDIARK